MPFILQTKYSNYWCNLFRLNLSKNKWMCLVLNLLFLVSFKPLHAWDPTPIKTGLQLCRYTLTHFTKCCFCQKQAWNVSRCCHTSHPTLSSCRGKPSVAVVFRIYPIKDGGSRKNPWKEETYPSRLRRDGEAKTTL